MSIYSFVDSQGISFSVKGEGISEAQAREIFAQQDKAGSLVGIKSGQIISAASQALGGLKSAQGQVAQALASGLAAELPGIDSVKKLQGLTAGLPVIDGITVADYALQPPALTGIDQASPDQIRGAMSQANKLVGQTADQISNALGVGKYGLDVPQLETAGYIKPGTAGKFLADGTNTLTDVLQSPTVWTGKDSINNQQDLLASPTTQDLVQTGLMVAGVAGLNNEGIATQLLGGAALAGSALVAAKGIDGALDWVQGKLPVADGIELSTLARDGEFAADFAELLAPAMEIEFPALPAIDTVDRATLNAATTRVLGNDKIPDLNYSVSAIPGAGELGAQLAGILEQFSSLRDDAGILEGRIARTRIPEFINEQYDNLDTGERLLGDLDVIKSQVLALKRQAEANDPPAVPVISQIDKVDVDSVIQRLEASLDKLRQKLGAGA